MREEGCDRESELGLACLPDIASENHEKEKLTKRK